MFWKFREITDTDSGEAKTIPMVPAYTVFNVEQCDGLDKVKAGEFPLSVEPDHVIGWCQSVGATIRHGGNRACFVPSQDLIQLPRAADGAR